MSQRLDDDQLALLLRALPAPEPSAEFRAAARRRYLDAIEARDRRAVLTGLMATLIGLAAIAALLGATGGPVALVAWLAEAAADLATWTTGLGVVLALVPLVIWTSAVLSSVVAVLSLVLVARAQSPALSK
jgi:membrane protein implicated in regulation of membrane protease activity